MPIYLVYIGCLFFGQVYNIHQGNDNAISNISSQIQKISKCRYFDIFYFDIFMLKYNSYLQGNETLASINEVDEEF